MSEAGMRIGDVVAPEITKQIHSLLEEWITDGFYAAGDRPFTEIGKPVTVAKACGDKHRITLTFTARFTDPNGGCENRGGELKNQEVAVVFGLLGDQMVVSRDHMPSAALLGTVPAGTNDDDPASTP